MKRSESQILTVITVLFITMPLFADTIDITTNADARIRGGDYHAHNFGSSGVLIVKYVDNLSYCRKSYMSFDISSITGTVTNATLSLVFAHYVGMGAVDKYIDVYGLDSRTWSEDTITWDNAPANDTSSPYAFNTPPAEYLGQTHIHWNAPEGTIITLSTQNLVDFLNNATSDEITIMINTVTKEDVGLQFASRENTTYDAPKLSVTFTPIPEPTMIALIGLGVLGFVHRK